MEELPLALSLTLVLLVMALAAFAAAGFDALLKGCFELRRGLRAASNDYSSLLLKSPIVPGVSVVFAPADTSPETRALVRRLLDLHFGRHELVLVLDAPAELQLDFWVQELHLSRQERAVPEDLPPRPSVGTTCRAIRFACWWSIRSRAEWRTRSTRASTPRNTP